jgi:translation elongation factor EF-G
MTQGRGTYSMVFEKYMEVPKKCIWRDY